MPKPESIQKAPWAQPQIAKGGCFARLLIANLWAILVACILLLFKPTEPTLAQPNAPDNDLVAKLKAGVDQLETPLVIRESELNAWLSKRLQLEMQTALLQPFMTGQGITVDLRPDEVDFILHWNFAGQPHHWKLTFSVLRKINRVTLIRGEIGHMPLKGAFLRTILPAFQSLLQELTPEYQLFLKYRTWDLTDDQVTLIR